MDTENIWIQVFAKLSDKEDEKKRSIEEIYNLMKKSNIKNRSIEILENDKLQIFTQLINYQASKQNILENIKKIEEYVERKNDLQFKKYIRNFKDYIEIEFKHIDYVNEVKNSIGEVEEFYDKVNENETRVITIKEQVEKTMEKIENSYSVFISILGIFSGIVLVFASGSSIWGSLFKDISKYNWRKIILIIGLSSLVTYNIVFMFIYFIAKLLDRNIATTKSSSEWIGIIALNTHPIREKQQYYRMCIPYIYAHWEGFVVESFKLLIVYLNNEHLKKQEVINELYTFSLQKVLKPLAGKQSFEQSFQFVEKFVEDFDKELYIEPSLLTANSNLNYKQMVIILNKFGMINSLEKYKLDINQLVNQRNSIAHGENGIIVEKDHVARKIFMLQEIFDLLILEFDRYLSKKMYLKIFKCGVSKNE